MLTSQNKNFKELLKRIERTKENLYNYFLNNILYKESRNKYIRNAREHV